MFGDTRTGVLLLMTHILSCLTVGIMFRFWGKAKVSQGNSLSLESISLFSSRHSLKNDFSYAQFPRSHSPISAQNYINLANLGEVLATAIMNSIHTILLIGGFVVLFSVIISMLSQSHILSGLAKILEPIFYLLKIDSKFSSGILTGLIELTNGVKIISSIPVKAISQNIIITSFLLGFGGVSILLQVFSIVSKVHLSIKPYIIGKVLHGIIAALYTYLFLNLGLFFNLDVF